MHEEMANLFQELATLTLQKGKIEGQIKELQSLLSEVHTREEEVRHQVGLAPATRTRRVKDFETVADIRRAIRTVAMKLVGENFLEPLPKSVMVKVVSQQIPEMEATDIEEQIVALSKVPGSCIKHNGMRGQGSAYTFVATSV